MSFIISQEANPNYLAKIIELKNIRKHSNADKLQVVTVDFQNVITGMDAKERDIYIYFPLECAINKDFLSWTNSFSNKEMNADKEVKGFFDKNGRVRAVKLRGEPSQGYVIPFGIFKDWCQSMSLEGIHEDWFGVKIGQEFDYWGNIKVCEKYVPRTANGGGQNKNQQRGPRISRLVDNQFRLMPDTENLRKNIDKLNLDDYVGIHYKKHGTSWVVGNVLVKRKLKWLEKLAKRFGVTVKDTEYDYVYSSRKVVKNEYETKNANHYYGYDLWAGVKDEVKHAIPKGYTLYGEALGYTEEGGYIQKDYDYGCEKGKMKLYIYRITVTNEDGQVIDLDDMQIRDFCQTNNLNYLDTFLFYGNVAQLYTWLLEDSCVSAHLELPAEGIKFHAEDQTNWREILIKMLEIKYNNKDCWMCTNKVPEEGIVVRKQSLYDFEAYKLKSMRFLEKETADLDAEVIDLETLQSEI